MAHKPLRIFLITPSAFLFFCCSKIDLRSKLNYFAEDLLKVFAWVDKNTKTACRMGGGMDSHTSPFSDGPGVLPSSPRP